MGLKIVAETIFKLARKVHKELGGSFGETLLQKALSVEFRKAHIQYHKELNIEIIYRGEVVGEGRLDFLLMPSKYKSYNLTEPVLIETKVGAKLNADHRQQVNGYLRSVPYSQDANIGKCTNAFLINFQKNEGIMSSGIDSISTSLEFWSYDKKSGLTLIEEFPK